MATIEYKITNAGASLGLILTHYSVVYTTTLTSDPAYIQDIADALKEVNTGAREYEVSLGVSKCNLTFDYYDRTDGKQNTATIAMVAQAVEVKCCVIM